MDYFCFGSFVFKTETFKKIKPFESIYERSNSIDISNIIKYLFLTDRIGFIDSVVYKWVRYNDDSISKVNVDDLVYQTLLLASAGIDIYNFFDDKSICLDVCNAYMEHAFNMILSYKEHINNEKNFQRLLPKLNEDEIYIYGRGWVGLELKDFLRKHNKKFRYFIDDFKTGFDDTITFEEFIRENLNKEVIVVIGSYKYKWIYKMFKRLAGYKNLRIFDLYGDE
jgi:hypothetical protein